MRTKVQIIKKLIITLHPSNSDGNYKETDENIQTGTVGILPAYNEERMLGK